MTILPDLTDFVIEQISVTNDVTVTVHAAFSNGPTEGHVNRLKLLKRSIYGRAKLELLRARVLSNV